ncbi:MAG: hypothetical protein RPS47_12945 [Colwellia sp.]
MNSYGNKNNFLLSEKLIPSTSDDKKNLEYFTQVIARNDYNDVTGGVRTLASDLLGKRLISMDEYVSLFGGHAVNYLSLDNNGDFYDSKSSTPISELLVAYSKAKYGSIEDIRLLAGLVISNLSHELDLPNSHWRKMFETAKSDSGNVVMMTTGWRNVPSTANVIYDIVVENINLKLANLKLPTIINVKLPRLAPPCENYASLSIEEREAVNQTQDHVIPAANFYQWSSTHVIFGDDVLVTGATADKILFESMRNGAKSFQSIYPVAINPITSINDASVEEKLNRVSVKDVLDDEVVDFISHTDFIPILRTLRLVFSETNFLSLKYYLPKVPPRNWLNLYMSAMGNDFFRDIRNEKSLQFLQEHLLKLNLLDENGLMRY